MIITFKKKEEIEGESERQGRFTRLFCVSFLRLVCDIVDTRDPNPLEKPY